MEFLKVKRCIDCEHSYRTAYGQYTCEVMDKIVIINDVPSEHHLCCKSGFDANRSTCHNARRVAQLDKDGNVIREYPSVLSAIRSTRVNNVYAYRMLNGVMHSANGIILRYAEDKK